MAAVGRLVVYAARGAAPPPEPGLLERLRRDRECRATVAIDKLSFVASPNGFLAVARAASTLDSVAVAAVAANMPRGGDGVRGGSGPTMVAKTLPPSAPLPLRPALFTTLNVKVGEFRSLLSLESRPLASLRIIGLALEASQSEWWDLDEVSVGGARVCDRGNSVGSLSTRGLERSTPRIASWPGWTWTRGRSRKTLNYMQVLLESVGVLDLTTDGQLHSEIISHASAPQELASAASSATPAGGDQSFYGRSSREREAFIRPPPETAASVATPSVVKRSPVIVIELRPADHGRRGREFQATLRGLRVCFLRRFMAEVTKYFGPDGLGPVFAIARSFGDRGKAVDEAEIDSVDGEEKKQEYTSTVNEQDEAMFDNWSIASLEGDAEDYEGSSDGVENISKCAAGFSSTPGKCTGGGSQGVGDNTDLATAGLGMRVTAVFENLVVVLPRSTHSLEAAAITCDELALEVGMYVVKSTLRELRWRLPRHGLRNACDSFVFIVRAACPIQSGGEKGRAERGIVLDLGPVKMRRSKIDK